MMLLPPSLEELIEENHPVRIVDRVIDKIDIQPLIKTYKGGGTSSYHPRMLLKVVIYSYLRNVYSTRAIEEQLKENIHFMWLSGMSRPDHNTLFRFRSKRLKGEIKKIFSMVVALLVEEEVISIQEAYLDGTKIEANANRYTFVWGRAIKTSKDRIKDQLESLWNYVDQVCRKEQEELETPDFKELSGEKVEKLIEQINEALQDKKVNKKVKQKLRYAAKNWPGKLEEYSKKEKLLGERKSYSKTDPDATFMRMKEDHMLNGQLKPAYNFLISTNQQFITCYTIEQTTTDTTTLKDHLEEYSSLHGIYPQVLTADAGFGSLENYDYLEERKIRPFVKFNYFHKEQTKKWKENIFKTENLYYNDQQDCYYCPMGQKMRRIKDRVRKTRTGYTQVNARYQAISCRGCPLRGQCHKSKSERIIEVNHKLNGYKDRVRSLLASEEGIKRRGKRASDVEATFGLLKNNKGFKRFMLRGKEKVEIEAGILAIAHNLSKLRA